MACRICQGGFWLDKYTHYNAKMATARERAVEVGGRGHLEVCVSYSIRTYRANDFADLSFDPMFRIMNAKFV